MKQLLTILLFFSFFISCSSDDDGTETVKTIIQVKTNDKIVYQNVTLGYFTKDNKCVKIANLGNSMSGDQIELKNDTLTRLYIFFDRYSTYMQDSTFMIKKGELNTYYVSNTYKLIEVDKTDEEKYPH